MNNTNPAAMVVIAIVVIAGLGGWLFLDSQKNTEDSMESITVAYSPFESTALFWIAEDQQFFGKNGLNITLRKYDSGAAALEGVVNGEADIAIGISEFPLVRKAFENTRARAIGNIDKGDFIYLVARRDRGIVIASDLEGKRIGTTIGTIAEFHLGRFLMLNGMTIRDITLVDVRTPSAWVDDVVKGDIDAIATAQPYVNSARDQLGDNAVVLPIQSSQPLFGLVISTDEWLSTHPEKAESFIRSLAQAEEYINAHPSEARAIVQKWLDLDAGYVNMVWKQNQFSLTLDQSLILAMEDEARWMIRNNLTNATAIPDFRNYLYTDGLDKVKPGSVKIIR
ncbi:MAG TPA: ABC transporter substrate-binding protein [Methanoregula sp.]|nr:ABC transporter substrate-binding protein [Methanoregula sp.]